MSIQKTIAYADDLARKNSEALSFIPRPKLEHYARRGQLMLEYENDEPCGFLVYGGGHPVCRIYQACVQYDARRREHGLRLVSRLVRRAARRGCHAISLKCADDLEANVFWQSAGFRFAGQVRGGVRRGRVLNVWVLSLEVPLFAAPTYENEPYRQLATERG